jgi:Fe-S oxidoreductase
MAEMDLSRALEALESAIERSGAPHLDACVRCGLCGSSCHIYLTDPRPENLPVAKLETVARVYRRRRTFLGRRLPWLTGARDLTEQSLDEIIASVYGRCTGCGRCSIHCAVGLDIASLIRAGRHAAAAAGRVPKGIQDTVDNQIRTGNQMAIATPEFLETADWLSEDLSRERNSPDARLRVDQAGARVLYLVNPREVKFFPLSLQAAAGIFHAAGESWTLSSRVYDVTNYGLFAGDDTAAAELTRRVLAEAQRLGVAEIILGECGHGFRAFRWEGPEWIGKSYPIPVRSVLELFDEYLAQGRLKVDPARNPLRVTLHDPCNLVRWGGVSEAQRRVLRCVVADFVEMTPNREQNYCCGGGGGLLSLEDWGELRVRSGRLKAEQVRATGAKIVATPCHNCADQLIELSRVYRLDVEIKSVAELLYDALVPA